jgi:uncharacterized tellurite resistance protein B-like protein
MADKIQEEIAKFVPYLTSQEREDMIIYLLESVLKRELTSEERKAFLEAKIVAGEEPDHS